jgi:hypothetical protein
MVRNAGYDPALTGNGQLETLFQRAKVKQNDESEADDDAFGAHPAACTLDEHARRWYGLPAARRSPIGGRRKVQYYVASHHGSQ